MSAKSSLREQLGIVQLFIKHHNTYGCKHIHIYSLKYSKGRLSDSRPVPPHPEPHTMAKRVAMTWAQLGELAKCTQRSMQVDRANGPANSQSRLRARPRPSTTCTRPRSCGHAHAHAQTRHGYPWPSQGCSERLRMRSG